MPGLEETEISRAIITTFHEKALDRIVNDIIIVGAGPSGYVGHQSRSGDRHRWRRAGPGRA